MDSRAKAQRRWIFFRFLYLSFLFLGVSKQFFTRVYADLGRWRKYKKRKHALININFSILWSKIELNRLKTKTNKNPMNTIFSFYYHNIIISIICFPQLCHYTSKCISMVNWSGIWFVNWCFIISYINRG